MMLGPLMALGMILQDDTPADVYERLKKQNLFSPKLERPKPPPPEPKVRDDKPAEPEKPKTFRFDVAGIVLHNADQVYEALLCDREYDEAKWMRVGDTWHEAKLTAITENTVEISVGDQPHAYRLGGEFEMLVEGRKGGRSSSRREEEKPSAPVAEEKPADTTPTPTTNKASGLLDKFRKAKGQE